MAYVLRGDASDGPVDRDRPGSTRSCVVVAGIVFALLATVGPGVILGVAGIVFALLATVGPRVILVVAGIVFAGLAIIAAVIRVVLFPGVLALAKFGRQEHRRDHVHDGVADLNGLRNLGRVAGALHFVSVDGELAALGRPKERVVALAFLHHPGHGVEYEHLGGVEGHVAEGLKGGVHGREDRDVRVGVRGGREEVGGNLRVVRVIR